VTFFVEEDAPRLQAIADCMQKAGCEVPGWMLLLKRGRAGNVPGAISERAAFAARQHKHRKQIVQQSKVCPFAVSAAASQQIIHCLCFAGKSSGTYHCLFSARQFVTQVVHLFW
jgi:hypothetical protein